MRKTDRYVYGLVSLGNGKPLGRATLDCTRRAGGAAEFAERMRTSSVTWECRWESRDGEVRRFWAKYRSRRYPATNFELTADRRGGRWVARRRKLGCNWDEGISNDPTLGFFAPQSFALAAAALTFPGAQVYDVLRNRLCALFRSVSAEGTTLELRASPDGATLDEVRIPGRDHAAMPSRIVFPRMGYAMELRSSGESRARVASPFPRLAAPRAIARPRPHRKIAVASFDGTTLAGQIDRAHAPRRGIRCLLIHGSGPEDRHSGSGHESRDYGRSATRFFADLSTSLTTAGIDVCRFDKRGVGESGGRWDETSRTTLSRDVAEIARFLKREAPRDRVVLLGVSEGANLALSAALESPRAGVDGLILAGGPAQPLDRVMLEKMEHKRRNSDPDYAHHWRESRRAWGRTLAGIRALRGAARQSKILFQGYPIAWWVQMLAHAPEEDAARLRIPVLIVHGAEDAEVRPGQARRVARAIRRSHAPRPSLAILPKLNHFFARARRPFGVEYEIPAAPDPRFIKTLVDWLQSVF